MRVALIVAMAANRVIGAAGGLPWHLPDDLRRFKALTLGKPIVMGRRTHDAIGRALPGRANIVMTRDAGFAAAGVAVAGSLDAALDLARREARAAGANEVMVIGGGEVYRLALPVAGRIYLTEVHAEVPGDAHFPALDGGAWRETAREDHAAGAAGAPGYSFVVLERVR